MRVDQLYGVNSIADVGITWRGHLPWKLEASVEFGVGRCGRVLTCWSSHN